MGLNNSLCNWILDFLTGRPQSVRVGHNTSSTTTLSTGAPQGCVLSPLLFTLLTHDCTAKFSSNHIIKFADDTSVVGLITTTMKRTTERKWHSWLNGVALTTCPSMWKRQRRLWWTSGETLLTIPHWPSTPRLWRESAELNSWGCTSQRTSWTTNTKSISKKAQQRLHFLRRLKRASLLHPSSPPSTGVPLRACDQLHHCLVRELLCSRPQDPPADSEHRCKNHWCPSPLYPGHFPAQATCSNTLSSACTRHFHTPLCVHNPTKDWL